MTQLLWYFEQGGFLMWPLLACSLIAVAIILERAWRLRPAHVIDPAVVEDIQAHIEKGQIEQAILRQRHCPVLVGRILSRGLEEYTSTSADIETSMFEAAERGLQVLSNNLGVLNLIAKVAPLLGLLGTVLGMIQGFEVLEKSGVGKEQLAGAIRVALITTATGLMVAIPTLVAAAYFRGQIRRLHAQFEEILIAVIKSVKSAPAYKNKTELSAAGSQS